MSMFDGLDLDASDMKLDDDEVVVEEKPAEPEYLCEICQTPLTYSGRGRKPKRCSEHRTRTRRSVSTKKEVEPEKTVNVEELEEKLTMEMAKIGTAVSNVLPVTGVTMFERAPNTAHALVDIARRHPKLLSVLDTVSQVVPGLEIAEFVMALGIAMMIDTGRMNPNSHVAQMAGLTETYAKIYPPEQRETTPTGPTVSYPTGLFEAPIPVRFNAVA